MAKRNRKTDTTVIERRIQEGRGQGRGAHYQPWLRIQDVASQGLVQRIRGWKTQRDQHFLSTLERDYFYVLEWALEVVDIREQYPLLPLSDTQQQAQACGFKHPADPHTKADIVMTTDFVVTVSRQGQLTDYARTIKPAKQLATPRVLEKLEIERRYWQTQHIHWGIVTEHELPEILIQNVAVVHGYLQIADRVALGVAESQTIADTLWQKLATGMVVLADAAAMCDQELALSPGTALTIAYHMIARHQWPINMNLPLASHPIGLLESHPTGETPCHS